MSDKVKQYFKDFPKSMEVFQTTDGFLFHKKHDAATHAATLKDKQIKPHQRGFAVASDEVAEKTETAPVIGSEEDAASTEETKENIPPADTEQSTADATGTDKTEGTDTEADKKKDGQETAPEKE